uniref:Erythropoietin n=1 Tax=Pseudonaja textilis TaxID=8673 RepID=A0A670Z4W9_PSETE
FPSIFLPVAGLILLLLVWASFDPALQTPAQPVCDQSVMNKFIQDAGKLERDIVDLCKDACALPEHVTVSDTRVNFPDWRAMEVSRQASEVWRSQALLSVAVGRVKSHQPRMQPFLRQLEVMESGLRSVREILRRHNAQVRTRQGRRGALCTGSEAKEFCPGAVLTPDFVPRKPAPTGREQQNLLNASSANSVPSRLKAGFKLRVSENEEPCPRWWRGCQEP